MKHLLFTLSLFLFFAFKINAQSVIQIGSTTVNVDTAYSGVDVPWEILYGPDNYLWVTERKGLVSRIDPVAHTKTVILDLTASIYAQSEAGLLGMKLHPNFATIKEVFLVYTFGSSATNAKERLVKYTYNNTSLVNPQILIDSIDADINHNGSRLLFLPDGTLLMTTGDALNTANAQNLNSKNGKVLRVNTNGTIPANNPFPGSYVYTYGHRNPQGLLLTPNGTVYESEHGPSNDDEFQILESSRNYGWPNVEGFCNLAAEITFCSANNVKEPIFNWSPTIAPADLIYYSNPGFPEFHDKVIMAVLKDKKLVAMQLNAAGTLSVSQASYLTNMFGRLRDLCVGPNNEIYIATNGTNPTNPSPNINQIIKLTPPNTVSVKEIKAGYNTLVYPTITKEIITVELNNPEAEDLALKISDVTGSIVRKDKVSSGKQQVSLNGLPQGIYFLTLHDLDNKQVLIKKIIKE
ncbi:MAG: PQQ-dependent sugar dehydrogenase [Bacteroidetes bacterium]|nr:PQQ-dependent sugar dehydrogenase [Bacteroidota bacterium]